MVAPWAWQYTSPRARLLSSTVTCIRTYHLICHPTFVICSFALSAPPFKSCVTDSSDHSPDRHRRPRPGWCHTSCACCTAAKHKSCWTACQFVTGFWHIGQDLTITEWNFVLCLVPLLAGTSWHWSSSYCQLYCSCCGERLTPLELLDLFSTRLCTKCAQP